MCEELTEAVDSCHRDDSVRTLVITGANGVFCSGGDLASFGSTPTVDESFHKMTMTTGLVKRLSNLEHRGCKTKCVTGYPDECKGVDDDQDNGNTENLAR